MVEWILILSISIASTELADSSKNYNTIGGFGDKKSCLSAGKNIVSSLQVLSKQPQFQRMPEGAAKHTSGISFECMKVQISKHTEKASIN